MTLVPIIKRTRDSGSPWQRPWEGKNKPKGLPFRRTKNEEVEIQSLIQLIQVGWNPKFERMASKKYHSILSKAFSISILTAISPPHPYFDFKVWNISWAKIELSCIWWLGTKAIWNREIILSSKVWKMKLTSKQITSVCTKCQQK
jgi:hypothetical protein